MAAWAAARGRAGAIGQKSLEWWSCGAGACCWGGRAPYLFIWFPQALHSTGRLGSGGFLRLHGRQPLLPQTASAVADAAGLRPRAVRLHGLTGSK